MKVKVKTTKRESDRAHTAVLPPEEVIKAWDNGNPEPFLTALRARGPQYLTPHGLALTNALVSRLHEWWVYAIDGDPEDRDNWQKVVKALGSRGRGDYQHGDKNPRQSRPDEKALSRAKRIWIGKYEQYRKKRGKLAEFLMLEEFDAKCRIQDPKRKEMVKLELQKEIQARQKSKR